MRDRTLGWVQDPSDFTKLRTVIELFSDAHNASAVASCATALKVPPSAWPHLHRRLTQPDFKGTFKELIGSKGKVNGLLPALLPGQSQGKAMSTWACSGFLSWAHALGLLEYLRAEDAFKLAPLGGRLLATTSKSPAEADVLRESVSSYPPAVRLLHVLAEATTPLTKYEIGAQLGFQGEAGFTSFEQRLIIDAVKAGTLSGVSDAEGTSDKYARMIANWLVKLEMASSAKSDRTGISQIEYRISYLGKAQLTRIEGRSKHPAVPQRICWEMLATKAQDRSHVRNYRTAILRCLDAKRTGIRTADIHATLSGQGFNENMVTLEATLIGLQRIGIQIAEHGEKRVLTGALVLDAPTAYTHNETSDMYESREDLRSALPRTPDKFLSLFDLALGGRAASRDFEILLMDYLTGTLGFDGKWLGGPSRPDGVIHLGERCVVVDAKAYVCGYPLNTGDQDAMIRYVEECSRKLLRSGATTGWWECLPDGISEYTYAFVAESFRPSASGGLANITSRLGGVQGTALRIVDLLVRGERFLTESTPLDERLDELFFSATT